MYFTILFRNIIRNLHAIYSTLVAICEHGGAHNHINIPIIGQLYSPQQGRYNATLILHTA